MISIYVWILMIFAELERRRVPRWALAAGVLLPIDFLAGLAGKQSQRVRS